MAPKKLKLLNSQCRMCLRILDSSFVKEIFDETDEPSEIYNLIFEVTGIKVSLEDATSKICNNCEKIIKISRDFKNVCLKANQILIEHGSSLNNGDVWKGRKTRTVISQFEELIRGHTQDLERLGIPKLEIELVKIEPEEIDIKPVSILSEIGIYLDDIEPIEPITCTVCLYSGPKLESIELNEEVEDLLANCQQLHNNVETCSNCKTLFNIISAYNFYRSNDSCEYLNTKLKSLKELLEKVLSKMDQSHQENFQNNINVGVEVCKELFEKRDEKHNTKKIISKPKIINRDKHVRRPRESRVCHICGYHTMYRQTLAHHINAHNNIKSVICDVEGCGKGFTYPATMYRHKTRVHSNKIFGECDYCGKQYKFRKSLSIHVNTHVARTVFCIVCQKGFHSKKQVTDHMKVHKTDKDKKLKCSFCPKRFFKNYALTCHLRVHTQEKPFPCDKCEMKFSYKISLQTHQKRYHPQ